MWWHLAPSPAAGAWGHTAWEPREPDSAGRPPISNARSSPQSVGAPSSSFVLPSGLSFSLAEAESRLLRFFREEYAYYDGIVDLAPDHIEPIDILATVSMNSRVNDAAAIRSVHRGLSGRCKPLLAKIPVDADLLEYDIRLDQLRELIHAAVQLPRVKVAVATKVLHPKRRGYIPMIDGFVIKHYAAFRGQPDWGDRSLLPATAATVAVDVARAFREDLRHAMPHIAAIGSGLANAGFRVSPVRILEVLIWTQIEPNRYYRKE